MAFALRRTCMLSHGAGQRDAGWRNPRLRPAARGEELTHGLIHDGWRISRDGKPVWADIFHAADADLITMLGHPAALASARASAMLVHVGAGLAEALALGARKTERRQ